jgi:hypothetical protein
MCAVNTGTPAHLKFTGLFGFDSKSDEPASKKRKTADDRALKDAAEKMEGRTVLWSVCQPLIQFVLEVEMYHT